jgi:hypothetical protein
MQKISYNDPLTHVNLMIDEDLLPAFFQILQRGFRVAGNVGCSVREFLCEQHGVAPEYLEKRIQTIFLDGKPVDHVDTAIVEDGATLSLSAALPGLIGAVMRRDGYYAPMRDQISYKEEITSSKIKPGKVFMKLFNLPLRELGPLFLERGILADGVYLKEVFTAHTDDLRKGCRSVLVNGKNSDLDLMQEMDWENTDIFLQVNTS